MKNKLSALALLFFVACTSNNHPAPVSTYQDLPTVKISDIKIKQSYSDVLQGEYSSFYDDDANTLDSIKKALQNDPGSNYLRVRLSYEYAKAENYGECLKLLDQVLKEKPKDFDALFLYARVLAVRGDFDQSKNYFLQILDLSEIRQDVDRKVDVSFILASLYVEKEEYKRAEELLKEIIDEAPDHLLAHYYLARVYSEQNRMDQALAMYKKAVDIDPRFSLAWKAIGLVDEYFKKWDQAIIAYSRVIELEPQNVDVRTRLIEIYQQQNKPDKIIAQIKDIKNLYPNVPDVFVRLGLFYYEQKQFKEAEDEFSQAIQKFRNNSDFYYYLGLVHYQMKRKDQAEKDFLSVQLNSDVYITSRLALSSLYEENKRPDQAEKNLTNALGKKPTSADLRIGLSNVMIRNKKFDEAQKLIEEGIQQSPKEEKYYLSLAEIYDRKKQYDSLEKTIRSLLAVYPDSASGLNFLGFSLVDRNIRIPEAESMLNRALALKPFDGYIVDSVGWLYFRKKLFKEAEKMFREALKDIPDEPIIMEHLGDTLIELNKKQEAWAAYKKVLMFSEDEDQKKSVQAKIQKLSK